MRSGILLTRDKSGFFMAVVAFIVLAPIWASPVLVTTDGPSHLYNSVVNQSIRSGQQPFVSYLTVREGWRPNRAADFVLSHLGPALGWEAAERALFTICVVASLVTFLFLLQPSEHLISWLVPIAAWMSQSWFVWMGFYDFSLSVSIFSALALVLEHGKGTARHLAIQVLLGLLYFSHLFTFAVGVALVFGVFAWRTLRADGPWWDALAVVPGLSVLVFAIRTGEGAAAVDPHWVGVGKSVAGLVLGDFIVSFHPFAVFVGVLIMAAVWAAALLRIRSARAEGLWSFTGIEIFAMLLLVVSVFAPFQFGDGSYIPARLRFLAVILFLPTMASILPLNFRPLVTWAGAAVLAALAMHGVLILSASRNVNRDLNTIQNLLTEAGARPGSWVLTKLSDRERGLFRISGYTHLSDRAGLRLGLVVLDNYEAYLRIFPVNWKEIPDGLTFGPVGDCWSVSLAPGQMHWLGPVLVVHDGARCIVGKKGELAAGSTLRSGQFAVTPLNRVSDDAAADRPLRLLSQY